MSNETKAETEMLNVQIDGVWRQFPKGTRAIEACKQSGSYVPHYCYHPKLSSPGNCRMCLVEMGRPKQDKDRNPILDADGHPEISWGPKPQISCAMEISEGMGIRTDSLLAKECRRGVMEFLLINHPLDCPICDKAGECTLQEYSVEYGDGKSRFLEHKVKKPKNVEVGPRITLDTERCILCSRCVRFMQEVADDDVLGFVDRGGYSTLAHHPDRPLDSNYSLNTVDICPVGALTDNDFRFKMRVWFLKETKSFCTSCATGCNTIIGTREGKIHRQTPRENNDVNECWMCDFGRHNFHYLEREDRLLAPQIRANGDLQITNWTAAISRAVSELKKIKSSETAIIASGRMTNEELFLTKELADALGTERLDIVPHEGEADKILVSADRNPNTAGAKLLGVATGQLAEIVEGVKSGAIKALIVLHEDLADCGLDESDLKKLESLTTIRLLPCPSAQASTVLLPGAGFSEKRGSMINIKGRIQRLNRATEPPHEARDDWEILRDLLNGVSDADDMKKAEKTDEENSGSSPSSLTTIEEVFKQMAASTPALAGLSLSKIGDLGKVVIDD